MKKWAKRISLGILALVIVIALGGYGLFYASLPQTSGTLMVEGAKGPINITRDANGIPHISADSENDLYFALGFVHAQDRLWQMEMNRRLGSGRLAEVLGEGNALNADKYFRTLGFHIKAKQAYDNMPVEGRNALNDYANGVNAYLAQASILPPEFILTGHSPEPWQATDTLVWMKVMWMSLSMNYRKEIGRAQLMTKLTPEQVAQIYPPYPGDNPPTLPNFTSLLAPEQLKAVASGYGAEMPAGYGSNNWVVSGKRTKSGMPMLANDPHLGLSTPAIWYLAHLHDRSADRHMIGVSLPGAPVIVLGRNDHIAWGFTNTGPDTQDLFIEKLVGDDQYLTPAGPVDFTTRTETINVSGGEPLTMNVRETRHGPVLSDLGGASKSIIDADHVLALQWTALMPEDNIVIAGIHMMKAQNFDDFVKAGADYAGPAQNMVYADIDGNIGYFSPARIPVRRADNIINGRMPSPGWDAKYDWQGFLNYSDLPKRFNPASGMIATANEKIVADDYPHFITGDWGLPYRGNRIRRLLEKGTPHDAGSFQEMHSDTISDVASDLLPLMLDLATDLPDDIRASLTTWDRSMDVTSTNAIIYSAWHRELIRALIADDLGDLFPSFHRSRPIFVKAILEGKEGHSAWCDIISTDETETCITAVNNAFNAAWADLESRMGNNDWQSWKYGELHTLDQKHMPFSMVPGLKHIFSIVRPQQGSNYTINVAGNSMGSTTPYRSSFGPSFRAIYDFADLNKSSFILPNGQSGHPMSPHYSDMWQKWNDVTAVTIPSTVAEGDGRDTLTLMPAALN